MQHAPSTRPASARLDQSGARFASDVVARVASLDAMMMFTDPPSSIASEPQPTGNPVVELSPQDFDAFLTSEGPSTMVVVDFYTVSS